MQTLWAQMLCEEQEQGIGPGGASQPPPPSPPLQPVDLAGRLVERLPIEEAEGCLCKLDELLITGDVLAMADAQDLADECGFTEQQCDAVLLDDVAWRAKYGTEHAGAAGVHGNADVAVQEPRGEATPAKSVATAPAMTKEHESVGCGSCSSSEGDARAASTTHPVSKGGDRRIGEIIGKILRAMAATDGGKMCMQPTVLQEAKFGCISLLGRSLDECLGGISDNAVAGLYAEHCMAPDSDDEFTTKHPAFHQGQMSEFQPNAQVELHSLQASLKNGKKGRLVSYDTEAGRWMVEMKDGDLHKLKPANLRLTAGRPTTPRDEFHAVVGAAGVDTKTWTLRPDAAPKCPAGGDVPGRVLRPIADFLGCAPAKHAKLSVCLHTRTRTHTHILKHTLTHTYSNTHTHTHIGRRGGGAAPVDGPDVCTVQRGATRGDAARSGHCCSRCQGQLLQHHHRPHHLRLDQAGPHRNGTA